MVFDTTRLLLGDLFFCVNWATRTFAEIVQLERQNKMMLLQRAAFTAVFLRGVASQTQYGGNSVQVVPDPPVVESRAFPAPNVTLYSPSFALNASFPQGWAEGTAGATTEYTLRKPAEASDAVTHIG